MTINAVPIPENEIERLEYLRSLEIDLESPMEELQGLANVASSIADTPIALVSLVGETEQYFAANKGVEGVKSTSREVSFCAHAIMGNSQLIIPDAQQDPRFAQNPLVSGSPHIRAYAGSVIEPRGGHPIGSLCVIDSKPREFSKDVLVQLQYLSNAAGALFVAYKNKRDLLKWLDEESQQRQSAQKIARHDLLTDLLNQMSFREAVSNSLAARNSEHTLILFDLDHFKKINDDYGHPFGDHYLKLISQCLKYVFKKNATIGRIGGDEFAALVPTNNLQTIERLLNLFRMCVKEEMSNIGHLNLGNVSIGYCALNNDEYCTYSNLFQRADIALYESKNKGRNRDTGYSTNLENSDFHANRAQFCEVQLTKELSNFPKWATA